MWMLLFQILFTYVIHSKCSKVKPAAVMTNWDGVSMLADGSWTVKPLPSNPNSMYTRVDYDYENGYVYVERVYNRFFRVKLEEGAVQESIANSTEEVISMAFDWVHKKFYWLDVVMFQHRHALHVAEPNGANAKVITRWTVYPKYGSAMVLDPYQKYVYVVTTNGLERIGMDGTGRKFIYSLPAKHFAIDLKDQRLYFMRYDGLSSVKLDNRGLRTGLTSNYDVRPVIFFKDNIFMPVKRLTDSKNDDYIIRYNTLHKNQTELYGPKSFFDFKIYDSDAQKAGNNPCRVNNGGCPHLCLPKPTPNLGKFTCECADGYTKSGSSCVQQ